MGSKPGRKGLFWTAVLLVLALVGLDLARGPGSSLRGWWTGLHQSRGEETRSLIDQFRKNQPRSRGR